jgi:hypothetical protein
MRMAVFTGVVLGLGTLARAASYETSRVVQVSGPSPFAACDVSSQQGLSFVNSEVEPSLAVNPANRLNIVAAWQQDWWSNGGARGLVTAASFDGGLNWTTAVQPFSVCSGGTAGNGGDFERAADPWVSFAPDGAAYVLALSVSRSSSIERGVLVSRSGDGGLTWSAPVTLIRDDVVASLVGSDKPSLTANPFDPSLAHAVWSRFRFPSAEASPLAFFHALSPRIDGEYAATENTGESWEPARGIHVPLANEGGLGHQIAVAADGTLIDAFDLRKGSGTQPQFPGYQIAAIRSSDGGRTWSQPIKVGDERAVSVTDPDTGAPIFAGAHALPDLASDLNPPSPGYGNVYAVWNDSAASFGSGSPRDRVVFTRSLDAGLSWSAPVVIDRSPVGVHAFMPSVEVAADGTIGVTYYDFRNNTADPGLPTDYWFVHCHPSRDCTQASSWAETHVAGPFDIESAVQWAGRGAFIGDYQGLAADGDDFLAAFVQAEPTDGASVYLARITRKEMP